VGSGAAQTVSVPPLRKEHACRTGSGHQCLRGGHQCERVNRLLGFKAESGLRNLGKNGNITVTSNKIVDTTNHLGYTGSAGKDASGSTAATTSTGTLTGIANTTDKLSGSISIQMGSGAPVVVDINSTDNTLGTLATALGGISSLGVNAQVVSNGDGTSSLQLTSAPPAVPGR